jgi:hypothetical protein
LKFISQLVVEAAWEHLRSLPPKEAMVALVVTDILMYVEVNWGFGRGSDREREMNSRM